MTIRDLLNRLAFSGFVAFMAAFGFPMLFAALGEGG